MNKGVASFRGHPYIIYIISRVRVSISLFFASLRKEKIMGPKAPLI